MGTLAMGVGVLGDLGGGLGEAVTQVGVELFPHVTHKCEGTLELAVRAGQRTFLNRRIFFKPRKFALHVQISGLTRDIPPRGPGWVSLFPERCEKAASCAGRPSRAVPSGSVTSYRPQKTTHQEAEGCLPWEMKLVTGCKAITWEPDHVVLNAPAS